MGWLVGRLGRRGRGMGMTMGSKERDMGLRLRWGEEEENIGSRRHLVVGFLGLLKIQRTNVHGVVCWGRV